ncbi:DinB family protein [Nocardia sp. NBC_00565]|uniref:DinB family protein n=1 Tax=Nocardia sp. NBC_00565 TaxID=2975993 RepID=UPI002E823DAC|nr:DinB family protein [Nocardia sp. NBC_00565]WUC02166.1 DinB family protein [Nocardia sp. NBC_00565]
MSLPQRVTDGPERVLLENMLDRNRAGLIDTVRGLSDEEARRRLVPSLTTPIALIKHAAAAERIWFQRFLESGGDTPRPGEVASFAVGANETLAEVIAEFERASERSRVIAAQYDLNDTKQHPRAGTVSIRWIYLLMIEEFARHAGHSDILCEQLAAAHAQ